MEIQELKPFSANWNQIKAEYERNNKVFETLKEAISDKPTIKTLDSLISNNKSAIDAMNEIEKNPQAFEKQKVKQEQ